MRDWDVTTRVSQARGIEPTNSKEDPMAAYIKVANAEEAGYHRQARVENAFFRYKSILGDRLRARTAAGQVVESVLACNVLNRITELGRPESFAIGR